MAFTFTEAVSACFKIWQLQSRARCNSPSIWEHKPRKEIVKIKSLSDIDSEFLSTWLITLYITQRTTSSLLQTFIKQAGLVVVCKDNNSVSGSRDRSLASRPESINCYSCSAGPTTGHSFCRSYTSQSWLQANLQKHRACLSTTTACLVYPEHTVRVFSIAVLLNTRKSKRQGKN